MERRWRVATVRLIRLTVLLLAGIAAGCASTRKAPESAVALPGDIRISDWLEKTASGRNELPESAYPVQLHTVTIEEACGTPQRWPISQECVNTMGYRYGPLLQRKSDLLMAVWRACPSAGPCQAVANSTPTCQEEKSLKSGSPKYEEAASKCKEAYAADYSCNALMNDPEFKHRGQVAAECMEKAANDPNCVGPDAQDGPAGSKRWWAALHRNMACWDRCLPNDADPDCKQAQAAFADFQDRVQKAMLDAELKAAFGAP